MDALIAENPRAVIGGNMPPEPTPFEKAEKEVNDLYAEAALWLDGKPIESQAQADDLSNLLNMIRAAEKRAEEARKAEKQPHSDAAKAVDAKYKPLIGTCQLASDACKKAIAPWLAKVAAAQEAAAAEARRVAEEATRQAQEAIRAADATNLEARAAAELKVKEAQDAEKRATRAGKATANAGGGVGRAVGLRTVYRAEIVDPIEFGRHCWANCRDDYLTFLSGQAKQLVDRGSRALPGVEIIEEKKAV